MNLIAAVDKNWAIGYKNELLVRIPEDQKWFRETTTGKAVIMGRKTLESFPNKSPLKNRLNVVITSDTNYNVPGAVVVHSIDEAVEAVKDYPDDDVYVIGGESIYRQMLPLCRTAHITKVDYAYQADAHFPDL
ncbi:MAG: dihydrofolate reductase, partial [Lachnospiraceae bacterium]|nr:dihydrofolate reductase [Lachnospiraceae bacterium]